MTKKVCQNAMAAHGSIDNIPGFDGLDDSQRAEVRIVFDNLLNTEAGPPATTTTTKKKAEPEADQEADELPEPADKAAAAPAQVGTKRKKPASTKKSDKARACPHLTMSEPRRVKPDRSVSALCTQATTKRAANKAAAAAAEEAGAKALKEKAAANLSSRAARANKRRSE